MEMSVLWHPQQDARVGVMLQYTSLVFRDLSLCSLVSLRRMVRRRPASHSGVIFGFPLRDMTTTVVCCLYTVYSILVRKRTIEPTCVDHTGTSTYHSDVLL